MLSVMEAHQQILAQCHARAPEVVPLSSDSLGRVLGESVVADLDMPPFDKALMDGYAIRSSDEMPEREVVEEILAGQVPTKTIQAGQAARIMTGAPVPAGADAVVPHERTVEREGCVAINCPVHGGMFVHRRAAEYAVGAPLLAAGTVLRPQELGLLAAVGRTSAQLVPLPRVAVLATGDELVEPPDRPGPGQLRNSNAPMLLALARRAPSIPISLGRARDREDCLAPLVRQGLETADVLVLAGGVSAGKADLVPGVLASLGVVTHFHHVAMKPGKPLLFGAREGRLVFGLPGNPVSAFVTFELFVRPALRKMAGLADWSLATRKAALSAPFAYRGDRPLFQPAHLAWTEAGWAVRPVPCQASADLVALLPANAFIALPAGEVSLPAGAIVPTLSLDG